MKIDLKGVAAQSQFKPVRMIDPNLLQYSICQPPPSSLRSREHLLTRNSIETISKSSVRDLTKIFPSTKSAKIVLVAARRVLKKRSMPADAVSTGVKSPSKRQRTSILDEIINPDSVAAERALLLPTSDASISDLQSIVLQTNRAPLVLAFAIVLLSYTYPHQPLSSRLSLAQAVVSANSRSKAISIGLQSGPSAEDEGFGEGQPRIKLMSREIRVLRRWSYEVPAPDGISSTSSISKNEETVSKIADVEASMSQTSWTESTVPLWGLDIEKLRDANKSKAGRDAAPTSALPIFTPQSARSYLLRSFTTLDKNEDPSMVKKLSLKEAAVEKEKNTALLLRTIDLLFSSWKDILSRDELDQRAWSWYVAIRPDIESGTKGWGEKGTVELQKILDLRRVV